MATALSSDNSYFVPAYIVAIILMAFLQRLLSIPFHGKSPENIDMWEPIGGVFVDISDCLLDLIGRLMMSYPGPSGH